MIRPIYIFLLALFLNFSFTLCNAQNSAQKVEQLMRVADEMFLFGSKRDALDIYQKIANLDTKNARAFFMLGKCYLDIYQKGPALENLQKAYKLNPKIDIEINLLLAKCQQAAYDFENASKNYTIYRNKIKADVSHEDQNLELLKILDKRIKECNTAKDILKDTVKLKFNASQDVLNSESPDYAPVLSPDEKTLYFTSRRQGSTGNKKDNDNQYYEDIYYSKFENDKWSNPINIGSPINTDFHEGCIGISQDGKELFIYREINGGDIFVSKSKSEGHWDKPKALNQNVNSEFYEPSMTLVDSGKAIIFSSNRPGGIGGLDLYISYKESSGDWGVAENMGPEINSPLDEDGPFYDEKSDILYYSSAGLKGIGGYDVYRSKKDSTGKWEIPKNLGYPINTPDDDIFYTLSKDGKKAFYSSYKKDGSGDRDIFQMEFPVDEFKKADSTLQARKKLKVTDIKRIEHLKEVEKVKEQLPFVNPKEDTKIPEHKTLTFEQKMNIKKIEDEQRKHDQEKTVKQNQQKKEFLSKEQFKKDSMVTIKGKIVDAKSGKPLIANIHVYDSKGKDFLSVKSGSDGIYSFKIPAKLAADYSISFDVDGYMYKADKIKYNNTDKNNNLDANVKLSKLEVGLKAVLRNVYFSVNSASLHSESYVELNKLVTLLNQNKSIRAKINGHTDNIGPETYNVALSKSRVDVVIDYLVKHGVSKDRLQGTAFGSKQPIASNDDEFEGRELNRRTEFEIIK